MTEIKKQLEQLWQKGSLPQAVLLSGNDYESLLLTAKELAGQILGTGNLKSNPDFMHVDLSSVENTRDLISFISLKSFGRRVIILGYAEKLNASSVNALLKTLEEPDTNSYYFVLTTAEQALLPTLRSRLMSFRETSVSQSDLVAAEQFLKANFRADRVAAVQNLADGEEYNFLNTLYKHSAQNLSQASTHRPKLILNSFQYLKANVAPSKALSLLAIRW